MNQGSSLIFLYTETPLHAGSGSALGAVDLPIQRERMSGLPMVQGSGIKGALRAELNARHSRDEADREKWKGFDRALFGREPPKKEKVEDADAEDKAGAMSLLDARLLLLPVRTVWGGFSWVTSPMILQRLVRDMEVAAIALPDWRTLQVEKDRARVGKDNIITKGQSFIVEDLEYEAAPDTAVDGLAKWLADNALPQTEAYGPFRERLTRQLAVVADDELVSLSQRATEVVTRIRIDPKTGIVEDGALWTEESLPAESLLWSVAFFAKERPAKEKPAKGRSVKEEPSEAQLLEANKLQKTLSAEAAAMTRMRLGGDRTVGRGIVGLRVREGSAV